MASVDSQTNVDWASSGKAPLHTHTHTPLTISHTASEISLPKISPDIGLADS